MRRRFRRFCAGESEFQNASRPIDAAEQAAREAHGVAHGVFPVAIDGITIAVNPQNTWAQCLSVDQLRALWETESAIHSWRNSEVGGWDPMSSSKQPKANSKTRNTAKRRQIQLASDPSAFAGPLAFGRCHPSAFGL
jgi:ABC-type phosphate transport system substrate-binding protein